MGAHPLKSALANGNGGNRSTSVVNAGGRQKSRGSSKSRSQRTFEPPKFGASNGGGSRMEAFEAKFDKYRANKRTKEVVEKRAKTLEQPDFDVTTKGKQSPSKKARKYTTVVGAELNFKPSGKFDKDFLMPDGYDEALMREELLNTRTDPFKVLGVSPEDKMTFFLLKWVFDYIKQDSDTNDELLEGKAFV